MTTTVPSRPASAARRVPLAVAVSSWAVPVLIAGRFALIAALPVAIASAGAFRYVRDRVVRRAAALLAVAYAAPLVVWLVRPDGAQSLSKDMHPAFAGLIIAASAALIVTLRRAGTR
ncbi:hypothetical protein [Streptomyces rimosus]|uniref:hypothetical protein n=1 Tax=Streptomyces rimosus TaxID=1927 RepID=UPI000519BEE2|nr:hypothetical protein [Streptomyces rimosus]